MLRYNVRPRLLSRSSDDAPALEDVPAEVGDQAAASALVSLGSLAFRERRLVTILRRLFHPQKAAPVDSRILANLPGTILDSFEWLAREAKANDIVVFPYGAPFISRDENTIIHRIAALQRPSLSGNWHLANALQRAMKACAVALASDVRRLPARAMLLERDSSQNPALRIEYIGKPRSGPAAHDKPFRRRGKLWDGKSEPPPGSLRARALEIVRRHPTASTAQFLAAGITHQYLSTLHKDGWVERTGHGIYRFPKRLDRSNDQS